MKIFVVDAFTSEPFKGNPAAVCLVEGDANESWMQLVGAEMNLSETAFLEPRTGLGEWDLRWFTPEVEVDLCGHATLAAAHVLWETGIFDGEVLRFHTRSGELTATRKADLIELDFPVQPPQAASAPPELPEKLGAKPMWVGRNGRDWLVHLETEKEVLEMDPDPAALRGIDGDAFIVTAPATSDEYDFISRFFAPALGVDEDPVTGSSHTALGPYWANLLGKSDLVARQASARGGRLELSVRGDRIGIAGAAVTILEGTLKT